MDRANVAAAFVSRPHPFNLAAVLPAELLEPLARW